MNKLEIGVVVEIAGHVEKQNPTYASSSKLTKKEYKQPKKVLVLGKSKRVEGGTFYSSNWDEPGIFKPEKFYDVWIVMEIDKNNRFRTPIAVFEDQIIVEKE